MFLCECHPCAPAYLGEERAGGETPLEEGESEKLWAVEWGGVMEPREDGENIEVEDIRAGGEPGVGDS